jgi:hypothetical protein
VTAPLSWEDVRGGLPEHQAEIMASYPGQPTIEQQDRQNGAGLPPVDKGTDDREKLT